MSLIEAESRRERGKHRAKWTIVELVVALALVAGTAFAFVGCTIQTGDGGSSTTAGGSPITTEQQTDTTATESTAGPGSTPSTATGGSGDGGLASPAQEVATKLGPSVVNIGISGTIDQGPFGQQQYEGEGSGVIYTTDGKIVTNNHVVTDDFGDPVSDIEVTLTTGEKLPATIVGRDSLTDLAVIQVDSSTQLPAAAFVTDQPRVGEYSIAIGSPLGFQNSVTLGIVSALGRSIDIQLANGEVATYTNLIQTDTPISPGNSGGALANASGQVIGINQAVAGGDAESIGFAIPSVVVTKVVDEIIQTGSATHAYLGVSTQTVTPELQQQFGLSRSSGVLVADTTPGSPAEDAGIQQGDIIVQIDGQDVTEASDVLSAIRDRKPGDTVTVTIDRDGTTQDITVTLEERPATL